MIDVSHASKIYRVHVRPPGFAASLRSLFRRTFREVRAVDDVSFSIGAGEIVGFLGPNGAGKTTTMKLLTGLVHPTSGSIRVDGYVPHRHEKAFKKRISLVMGQKSQLVWDIPASESLLINKEIYEIPDAAYRRTLDMFTELLGLAEVLHKPARQLSLGERMKCELAAALLHRPEIVFLDEPTIGLDVQMQEAVRGFIRDYNRECGATVLLTSHYMADVAALCKRILVINHGKLLVDGPLDELIDRFGPVKRIELQLSRPVAEADAAAIVAAAGGSLSAYEPMKLAAEVARDEVTALSARLLTELPVVDLTIEEPSLESVIGKAFEATPETGAAADATTDATVDRTADRTAAAGAARR